MQSSLFRRSHVQSLTTGLALGSVLSIGLVAAPGCKSSITINSVPQGATLYIDGQRVGQTPYVQTDAAIVGSSKSVKLEMAGFQTLDGAFEKDGDANIGAIIAGVFFLFPFLWTLDYPEQVTYELQPIGGFDSQETAGPFGMLRPGELD